MKKRKQEPQAVPMEQELWHFLTRKKHILKKAFIGFFILSLLSAGIFYVREQRKKAVQCAYQEAHTEKQKITFAEKYPNRTLTGCAYLWVADVQYERGNQKEATTFYTKAAAALPKGPLQDRARLGRGVSQLLTEGSLETLETLAKDARVLEAYRAEAAFLLGIYQLERKEYQEAYQWLCKGASFPSAPVWFQRSQFFIETTPELYRQIEKTSYSKKDCKSGG